MFIEHSNIKYLWKKRLMKKVLKENAHEFGIHKKYMK